MVSAPAASQRPFGSAKASVAMVSPETMPGSSAVFWASAAAFMMAVAASTAEAKYGAQTRARPISSSTMPSSTNEKPWPPYSSGTCTPQRPSC